MPLRDVQVTARITPGIEPSRDFGVTMLLDSVSAAVTDKDQAQAIRSVNAYSSLQEVTAAGFPDAVEAAAGVYFSQDPYPKDLVIGTAMRVVQPTIIIGQDATATTQDAIRALGASAAFSLNGVSVTVDLSSATTLATAGTLLAAALNAESSFSGINISVDGTSLIVQIPSTIAIATGFAAGSAATALGLTGDDVVMLARVAAAEDFNTALARIAGSLVDFYWVGVTSAISAVQADIEAVATWVAAQEAKQLIFDVSGSPVLVAGESASIGAVMSAKRQNAVSAIFGSDDKGIGYCGIFSSVDFDVPGGQITGKFKRIQGTTADKLTVTQIAELDRKRINHYTRYTAQGTSFGTWIDAQYWIDWFSDTLRREVEQLFIGTGVIPYTSGGAEAVRDTIIGVCESGVTNGGIAPNTVSPALRSEIRRVTGNTDFDGFLSTGYLVHVESVASQSQADRSTRTGPGVKVFVKGAGAIHELAIDVTLEQ
ncbi:MAG: DUF3383 family protein [Gemmatimonadota bacterium]|nr:DUF3383 family protein [Gemmatimonadota bacterium]